MAQPAMAGTGRYYTVGDYIVGKQIGAGSFSTVWHAHHRVQGIEVAIKEIVTSRLNPKLQESLKSEIFILKRINHPNIIRLHDMIEESGKIYIVLEFCRGGDLSMYIHRCKGKIPEATAKHFMQHLAAGLKVLREYSLIHRDLKPQNLLLSTKDDKSVLKIADFGFARSLQPRGLAETLCGSPLYMAPEIMQLQKYDAKADLWSVGAILFQLVTGKTPFTGSNQIQLLQNIIKATELQFPLEAKHLSPHCIDLCRKLLRRDPVERLTFEEFFNHPYLSQRQTDESLVNSQTQKIIIAGFSSSPQRNLKDISQDHHLPFSHGGYSSALERDASFARKPTMKSTYGFSLKSKPNETETSNLPSSSDDVSKYNIAPPETEIPGSIIGSRWPSEGNPKESFSLGLPDNHPKVTDSLELIDQDYVFVSGPPMDLSSSGNILKPTHSHSPRKTDCLPFEPGSMDSSTNPPLPVIASTAGRVSYSGNIESNISAPVTSHGVTNSEDTLELPSMHCMTRIRSLKQCASAITELVVAKKIGEGRKLEAFSIQLIILSIWKQALHVCHTHAASAIEVSPSQETMQSEQVSEVRLSSDAQKCPVTCNTDEPMGFCCQIEKAFLSELRVAEELSEIVEPGNLEMPDAMEMIYQTALALGKHGAVDEYMGDKDNAAVLYSKAVQLLVFLLVEAPLLILNPPFSLTNSDRYRIQNFIDVLNHRQSISQSQKLALFKFDNQSSLLDIGDGT